MTRLSHALGRLRLAPRRVPTILQQEAVECGAACLAMVMAFHGHWVPLERMRELCGVGRDGTKATNMVKAARGLGMVAKGLRKEIDELASVPTPFIVFWNFNHFVVVESVDIARGQFRLNDPAGGPCTVTGAEFSAAFTGVVLAFQTGPDFQRQGERAGLLGMIGARLSGQWLNLAGAALAGLLLIMPNVVVATFTGLFIDSILVLRHVDWLPALIGGMVFTSCLRGVLGFLQQNMLARTQVALSMAMAGRQMWRVLHLPLVFFSQRFPGDIANRFSMVDRFCSLVTSGIAPAAISLTSISVYAGLLFFLDPVLALVAVAAAAGALLILYFSSRGLEEAGRRMISDESRLQAATIQGMTMIDEFRVAGAETMFIARWSGYLAKVQEADQTSTFRANLLSQASSLVIGLGTVAILVLGGLRIIDGALSIGSLVAFQTLSASFFGPVMSLVGIGSQAQQVRGVGERLDDITQYAAGAAEAGPDPSRSSPEAAGFDLVLENVSFRYGPTDPLFIEDLSLTVPTGTRIALVGSSGSGKSTLGRLIVGLATPTQGRILVGGRPLPDWPAAERHAAIAYVEPNVGLFGASVRDNITLWDATIPEEQVVTNATRAMAHDFITRRPGGYGAVLADSGRNISGGERQRLAIARALVVNPAILVFDEATSALDSEAEQRVMDNIRRQGCTCIIIAHRLSTIRDCDMIIVMDRGRIVEFWAACRLNPLRWALPPPPGALTNVRTEPQTLPQTLALDQGIALTPGRYLRLGETGAVRTIESGRVELYALVDGQRHFLAELGAGAWLFGHGGPACPIIASSPDGAWLSWPEGAPVAPTLLAKLETWITALSEGVTRYASSRPATTGGLPGDQIRIASQAAVSAAHGVTWIRGRGDTTLRFLGDIPVPPGTPFPATPATWLIPGRRRRDRWAEHGGRRRRPWPAGSAGRLRRRPGRRHCRWAGAGADRATVPA